HAEHGLADKWYPHQESIRVPLIVFDPRLPDARRGRTHDAMTLNVDLAPTMLTSCGLSVPETMQGRDLSPLWLGDTPDDWRTDFFYEHPVIRSSDFIPASEALVEKEWKYFYWPDFDREQLFHLATDPREESDLVDDPMHQDRLLAMRKRFQELKADAK
ncbi:MAG: sulfatase/phosphatase domain-containing protein, partial [Planctomycetota bacterium]